MKLLAGIFILIVFSQWSAAQKVSSGFPKKDHYKKGLITLKNNIVYDVNDILITDDSLSFKYKISQKEDKIAISEIDYIYVKKGTAVVSGAVIGVIIPFMFTLESLLNGEEHKEGMGWRMVQIYGSGALIGASIGLLLPIWKTYSFDKSKNRTTFNYKLKINSNMAGVSLVIDF